MKRIIKSKHIFLCILLLLDMAAFGQLDYNKLRTERVASTGNTQWTQVSPGNAGMTVLVRFHPTNPNKILSSPDMLNNYQTDDKAKSWYSIQDSDGDNRFADLRDAHYSEANPNFAAAIAASEIWTSNDGGKSWELLKNCPWYANDGNGGDRDWWKSKMGSISLHPTNKDIMFAGGGSNAMGNARFSVYLKSTAANPRGESQLNEGKLWRTTDGGVSWQLVTEGLPEKVQVGRIIVNPTNIDIVYAATNYGLFKSTNGGTSWSQIAQDKLDNNIIMDMDSYYNPTTGKFILYLIDQVQLVPSGNTIVSTGGMFYSEDGANTWYNMNGNIGIDINRLSGGVEGSYYNYLGRWLGISSVDAKSRYPVKPTAAIQNFCVIRADPSREGAVYVGFHMPQRRLSFAPGRLWVTENYGKTWINTARVFAGSWETDAAYWNERENPTNKNMDNGHSSPHQQWDNNYAMRSLRHFDVGPDGTVIMLSDHSTTMSTDNGKTFQNVDQDVTPEGLILGRGNSDLSAFLLFQDRRQPHTSYLGSSEHHLFITKNETYPPHGETLPLKFIKSAHETTGDYAMDPYDPNIIYSTSRRQYNKQYLGRTLDGGNTWDTQYGVATTATDDYSDWINSVTLEVDPINNQYMYHGITNIVKDEKKLEGGFYYSTNNGKTFTQNNEGLPLPARVSDIVFDPRDETRKSLFIALEHVTIHRKPSNDRGGLFHSSDRGQTWEEVSIPFGVFAVGVNEIVFDHSNRMYITAGHRADQAGGKGVWHSDDFGQTWTQTFRYEGAYKMTVSPFDRNLIAVAVELRTKNPGVYISKDRGETWEKHNKGLTTSRGLEDIEFDIFDASKLWVGTYGTGWYIGSLENGDKIQVVEAKPDVMNGDLITKTPIQMTAQIVNPEFEGEQIVWKTENPAIATVDNTGLVTPVGKGHTRIWATTADGRYSDFSVITVPGANISTITDLDDNVFSDVVVYPNPTRSKLKLTQSAEWSLKSLTGVTLSSGKGQEVDMNGLEPGMYLLKLGSKTIKIIKE